jgi:two-component system, sensor histidine kinase
MYSLSFFHNRAMLNEGDLPKEHDTTIQDAALRGMEMLRHLPVPVAQYDKQGQTMCENPESSKVFGATASSSTTSTSSSASTGTAATGSRRTSSSSKNTTNKDDAADVVVVVETDCCSRVVADYKHDQNQDKNNNTDTTSTSCSSTTSCCMERIASNSKTATSSNNNNNNATATTRTTAMTTMTAAASDEYSIKKDNNTFVSRFVDRKLGERIFQTVLANGQDYMGEVQQFTALDSGQPRWFAIKVRRSKDPITGQPVLLYSARDITMLHQARKEADEANLAKSEFMAIMAHEIRTPLHQVLGFMELLGETITKPNNNNTNKKQNATASSPQEALLALQKKQEQKNQEVDFFNLMHDAAQSLYIVINDLMDYTKLEAGKMKLEYTPFEWRTVVNGCLSVMAPRATDKQLVMEFLDHAWDNNNNVNNDTSIPNMIVGDPNRIRQLLSNLLQNAVKFTHQGSITLSVKPLSFPKNSKANQDGGDDDVLVVVGDEGEDANHGNTHDTDDSISASSIKVVHDPPPTTRDREQKIVLKFVVSDTGIGLSRAHADKLFQKYQQADESIARTHGGTGLGLAICKSLVEAMGGIIGVDSEVGVGSRFWFQVPFGIVRTEKNHEISNSSSGSSDVLPSSINNNAVNISLVPEKAEGLHVLIVEDNLANQKLVTAMLKRLGHTATVVDNGLKAVDLIGPVTMTTTSSESRSNICNSSTTQHQQQQQRHERSKFDMVLMDVQMPVMGGMEATKRIRERGWTCQTLPIVGLTADFRTAERSYYKKAGMNDCLGKPIRMQELKTFLAQATKKKLASTSDQHGAVDGC